MSQKRSQARQLALQAIYQWQMTGQDSKEILQQFLEEQNTSTFESPFFQDLLQGVPACIDELDELLKPSLDRAIESVDPVERAILRIGAYELSQRLDVPYRVVINESVELAKVYGAEQSHKYINGVLDKLAKQARAAEIEGKSAS